MWRTAIALLLYVASCTANAQQAKDLSEAYARLHQFCGYKIGKYVSRKVVNGSSEENEISTTIRFQLHINGSHRKVPATLEFGCQKENFPLSTSRDVAATPDTKRMTAKDVIASEDSGGRYYRMVSWQRDYRGGGLSGTVAYVNRVFGDGVAMSMPELYFACPNKPGLVCYSVEVAPNYRLTKTEQVDVMNIVSHISYAPCGRVPTDEKSCAKLFMKHAEN